MCREPEKTDPAVPEASTMQRSPPPQVLVSVVFDASAMAVEALAVLAPEVDRDRAEYSVASILFEEAWVSGR